MPRRNRCRLRVREKYGAYFAGTGAAAHAGGDEDHIGTFKFLFNFFFGFFRSHASDFRTGAGAQSHCGFQAELNFAAGFGMGKGLCIGVGDDEVNALQILINHVIDGIAAAAADSDDGNPRFQVHDGRFGDG